MKPEEQVQIANFKAQYNSILGNIAVANDDLQRALEKKDSILNSYDITIKNIEEKTLILEQIQKESDDLKADMQLHASSLARDEEILIAEQKAFANYRFEAINLLERDKNILIDDIKSLTISRQSLRSDIIDINQTINDLKQEWISIEQSVSDIRSELSILENSLAESRENFISELKSINQSIVDKQDELKAATEELNAEKERITRPLELVQEENDKLDRKRRNLDILIARFRKEYVKLYPDQELKI